MTTLYSYTKCNLVFTGYLSIIIGITLLCLGIFVWKEHKFYKKPRIAVCIACGVAFIALTFVLPTITCERHYILECTVDESYSAVKLYNNYEVKSKRGDIWVLEKRNGVEESDGEGDEN